MPDGRFLHVARPGRVSVIRGAGLDLVATIETPSGEAPASGAADIVAACPAGAALLA